MKINYQIINSKLGYLSLASTEKGFCSIRLGDDKNKLERELKKEFDSAELISAGDNFKKETEALVGFLSGRKPWPRLPYDVKGTPFQQRVWKWLRTIPSGKTYHYSDAAKAIGRPAAVRAVARACASNRVALVIPCHRIVPKAGGVGGYRWSPNRKQKLLNLENAPDVNSRSFSKR